MKNIFSIVALLFTFSGIASAQSMSCVLTEDSTKYGAPGAEIIIHADVTNLTTHPIMIETVRLTNNLAAGWSSYFCLVDCMPPSIGTDTVELNPSAVTELTFHFLTSITPDSSTANLRLTVLNGGASDVWYKTFKGVTEAGFVSNDPAVTPSVSVFPNPVASGQFLSVTVNHLNESGMLRILDLNGRVIRESVVTNGQNEISTSGLTAGMYLYNLNANGFNPVKGKFTVIE
jgi:Secretion system C-terminal sorting domain